jgi:hypothetical protein
VNVCVCVCTVAEGIIAAPLHKYALPTTHCMAAKTPLQGFYALMDELSTHEANEPPSTNRDAHRAHAARSRALLEQVNGAWSRAEPHGPALVTDSSMPRVSEILRIVARHPIAHLADGTIAFLIARLRGLETTPLPPDGSNFEKSVIRSQRTMVRALILDKWKCYPGTRRFEDAQIAESGDELCGLWKEEGRESDAEKTRLGAIRAAGLVAQEDRFKGAEARIAELCKTVQEERAERDVLRAQNEELRVQLAEINARGVRLHAIVEEGRAERDVLRAEIQRRTRETEESSKRISELARIITAAHGLCDPKPRS